MSLQLKAKTYIALCYCLPATVVHKLAQQLNRWLCPIFLHHGHVQVIHKHHHVLANGRPKHTLAALVELAVNDVLRSDGAVQKMISHIFI